MPAEIPGELDPYKKYFDEAVALFNQTEYGLTGGLFSRSRKRSERAKRQFYVGNLRLTPPSP